MQEAMVEQVIIDIGNEDREGDTPPEFLNIGDRHGPVLAQRIDELGIGVFAMIARFSTQHGRSGNIHQAATAGRSVEALDQGYGRAGAIYQTRGCGIDPRTPCQSHCQHLTLCHGPLVGNARKFADRQPSVFVQHRTFGAQSAQRGSSPAQIGQIGSGFGIGLNSSAGGQDLLNLD